jgi:hypothetical protein
MTTYNKARDYLLIALSSVGKDDSMKAIAALRAAVMQQGCSQLVAELESLSRTEFELAAEEVAKREDNADGTDGNYPKMPDGWDNSKHADNNVEDIPKGNSLDNYPSTRVDFLMDGKTGADSGNYSGPEISSDKLSYPGVDGNGSEDFDSAGNDTAVKDIQDPPKSAALGNTAGGGDPQDIGEGFADDNPDQTGIRDKDMMTMAPNVQARADGTSGEGSTADSFNYSLDGEHNNSFDMSDFTKANPDLLEDLEDIDDEYPEEDELDEDDEILLSPDSDWDAFILEDETANFSVDLMHDQYPVDLSDKESNPDGLEIASEDMPAKIWDRGEEGCSTEEEADTDTDGDLNNTEIDEQNAKALDEVFAALDQVLADTDTSGDDDSLDVAPPVVGSVTPGEYWYQHASISEPVYHKCQAELHLAEAKAARKAFGAARIEGNKEAAEQAKAVMHKAERWYKLHQEFHLKLLQAAGAKRKQLRLQRAMRNQGRID